MAAVSFWQKDLVVSGINNDSLKLYLRENKNVNYITVSINPSLVVGILIR